MDNGLYLILGVLLVAVAVLFAFYRYTIGKLVKLKSSNIISDFEYKSIISVSIAYFVFLSPQFIFSFINLRSNFGAVYDIYLAPFYFVTKIIPVYVAALLFYRIKVRPHHEIVVSGNTTNLNNAVNEIFDSKEFYKAVSTVLPKGNKDDEYGFDYIPYMLTNLQDKRRRFSKSSNKFLTATICLSVFFILMILVFSYILLNESSIGIYKDINNLKSQITESDLLLSSVKIDLSTNEYFLNRNRLNFEKLKSAYQFKLLNNENKVAGEIEKVVYRFETDGNIEKLQSDLTRYRDTIRLREKSFNEAYMGVFTSTLNEVNDFIVFRNGAFKKLANTQTKIDKLLPEIEENLNKPANTQNELIKRLILSIVVVSFFLAVLKYFRNLYQSHYNEMLRAEQDDLLIRKFYVTFKSSENNKEERKIALSSFLNSSVININNVDKEENQNKDQKVENEVLKDLLNAVLKKI